MPGIRVVRYERIDRFFNLGGEYGGVVPVGGVVLRRDNVGVDPLGTTSMRATFRPPDHDPHRPCQGPPMIEHREGIIVDRLPLMYV